MHIREEWYKMYVAIYKQVMKGKKYKQKMRFALDREELEAYIEDTYKIYLDALKDFPIMYNTCNKDLFFIHSIIDGIHTITMYYIKEM